MPTRQSGSSPAHQSTSALLRIPTRRFWQNHVDHEAATLRHLRAELHQAHVVIRELEALTLTDALTGLANRRAVDLRLAAEISRADRSGLPLSLVVLDLDNFKLRNDTHGHPAGDAALRTLARVLTSFSRAQDTIARIGGEEFAMIFPGTTPLGRPATEGGAGRRAAHGAPGGDSAG